MARVGIKEVAFSAGVSAGTVSKIFNPKTSCDVRISQKTRELVLNVAGKLGYIPSLTARNLASGRSRNIGLILCDPYAVYHRLLIKNLETAFARDGLTVSEEFHNGDPQLERRLLESFFASGVEFLIINRSSPDSNGDMIDRFIDSGIPVLNLGEDDLSSHGYLCVAYREELIMELILKHLEELGIKRVGYVCFADYFYFSGQIRQRNLQHSLQHYPSIAFVGGIAVKNFSHYRDELAQWLADPVGPQALICYNDELAANAINVLASIGKKVPQDMSVIGIEGFDNPFHPLPLTSVKLPLDKIAAACYDTYVAVQAGQKPQRCIIAPELIVRQSSCPPRKTNNYTKT